MEPEGFGDGVEELAAKALRPPQRLSAEDLVASELASAVLSEPLAKIRHVCEALMLLDGDEREQAGITKEEAREAEKLYALATALQNAHINREIISFDPLISVDRYAMIPWPFPCEEAEAWLDWVGDDFHALYWMRRSEEQQKKVEKKIEELTHLGSVHFITRTQEATMDTYKGIVIRFTNYAMPRATVLMKKIIRLVSPDSYRQALQILRGGKRGKPRT